MRDTVWILISCPHQQFITYTNVKISLIECSTSCFFCVNYNSLNLFLFVMNNRNGSTYIDRVHQHVNISRGLGDRWDNGERPETSTTRVFLPHDQIMTFGWMWTVTWLFKRETVCGGWDHKMCHVIRWGALYSLFTCWCTFILGAGILLYCSTNWMIKIDIALI